MPLMAAVPVSVRFSIVPNDASEREIVDVMVSIPAVSLTASALLPST